MKEKLIVVFDIDNTIYDNDKKSIHPDTVKLIKTLHEKENLVGIATGRSISGLNPIESIKEYLSFFIVSNGMEVYYPTDKLIYQNNFSTSDLEYFSSLLVDPNLYVGFGSKDYRGYLERSLAEYSFRGDVFQKNELISQSISSFWLVSPNQELINNYVTKISNLYDCFLWTKNGCDVVKKGHNKYSGLLKVVEKQNTKFCLVCVGDGQNDLPLIEKADIAIGFRNSRSSKLRQKSHYLFDSCYSSDLYNLFCKLSLI